MIEKKLNNRIVYYYTYFKNMSKTLSDAQLAKQYQRKTDKQHILDNPDTYIGAVENVDAQMWVYDDTTNKIVLRDIEYVRSVQIV